jgi:hypothetical protein
MYNIHSNISDIYDELEEEISGFKEITDDLWRSMLQIGAKTQFRRRRDAGYGNEAPSGNKGPSGGYEGGATSTGPSGPSSSSGPAGKAPKLGASPPATPGGASPPGSGKVLESLDVITLYSFGD